MKKAIILLLACFMILSSAAAEECRIPGSMGDIYAVLKVPQADRPVPLIILCHGFGGSHVGNLNYADYFAAGGFAACSLDFCGGGLLSRSAGKMTDMTVLTEAQDLNAVINHFLQDPRFSSVCLWGESQGGFVSSYVAASRPEDIAALVLEYSAFVLVDTAKASRREDGTFPETGRLLGMKIGRAYYEALAGIDIYGHISAYRGPVLILHGDRDRLVPLSYSERALDAFDHAELVVIPGQGHGFMFSGRRDAMEKELTFFRSVCE